MEIPSQITTVLLIDPSEDDRQHWKKQLKRSSTHYQVFEAENAESGLAIYGRERIDCVVLEPYLPDISGFLVLLRLNPIVRRRLQTPVVALSHFILPSIVEAARKLGAQSYLVKSQASPDELDRAIQNAVATVGATRKDAHASQV
jgi:DNA-binding NarL/FixJ family response regulator